MSSYYEAIYICKDNGDEYKLMDAIGYWYDNYDVTEIAFAKVFTLVEKRIVGPQQIRLF